MIRLFGAAGAGLGHAEPKPEKGLHQCRHLPGGAGGRSLVQNAPALPLCALHGRPDETVNGKECNVRHE